MFGHIARACRSGWRSVTFAAVATLGLATVDAAEAETRYLKFYNLHTHEKGAFPYKVNGRYVASELKKINYFLRDWRKNQATTMDPQLLDLIWEAYRQSGASSYINVICGYRSAGTNNMLRSRSRSSGVAQKSQHTLGKALDFYIPGVPLKKMREIGLRMQVGGVGYYPTSGSPFVHFDVGRARHWPRMSRSQLLAVFPRGNTVHVPSDGKPLPGYQQALASYKERRSSAEMQVANAGGRSSGGKTLLSFLFGGGSDEAEDDEEAQVAPAEVRQAPARVQPAAPVQEKAAPEPQIAVAAVIPQPRPSVSDGVGVTMPEASDAAPAVAAPVAAPDVPAAPTQTAMLAPARIPFPTFAPSRQIAAVNAEPTVESLAAKPAVARADEATVSSLIADLQTGETPDLPATRPATRPATMEVASVEQVASAVPTPRERPEAAGVADEAGVAMTLAEASAAKSLSKGGVLAAVARSDAATIRVAAIAPSAASSNAVRDATVPTAVPHPSTRLAARGDASAASTLVTPTSLGRKEKDKGATKNVSSQSTFANVLETAKAAGKSGKGGRVRGNADAGSEASTVGTPRFRSAPVDHQDLIASRIEMASLVSAPEGRAPALKTVRPHASRLVVDVPAKLYTSGFSKARENVSPDRFSGSAVTFMPVVTIKP